MLMFNGKVQSKSKVILPAVVGFFMLCGSSANAEIYKWIDSNGATHYSDERPEDERIKPVVVKILPGPSKSSIEDADQDKSEVNDEGDKGSVASEELSVSAEMSEDQVSIE
uniref:DUF4124 domain-containing protein n=1 Tax=uncultured Thiotrichaceae bacterium TaxID=298394 RepID=A0A6S6UGZ0_9GAMM|nr:MAG: Unknown protein [uncultured Thiotrichaceae bacterium]